MAIFLLSRASRSRLLKPSLSLLANTTKSTVISHSHPILNPNLNPFPSFQRWTPNLEESLRFVSIARICSTPSGSAEKEDKKSGNNSYDISWIDLHLPKTARPYARLARLDKPIGTWLLAWPCMWSITMAAAPGHLPDLKMLTLFGCGSLLLRGAGCTVNDLIDRDIDTKDKDDDLKVGVKSTALRFGDSTKKWISGFGIACVSGLALSGFNADIGWPYYAFLVAASGHLGWQIWTVDLSSRADCNRKCQLADSIQCFYFLVPDLCPTNGLVPLFVVGFYSEDSCNKGRGAFDFIDLMTLMTDQLCKFPNSAIDLFTFT